jgi:hypothetical protein
MLLIRRSAHGTQLAGSDTGWRIEVDHRNIRF